MYEVWDMRSGNRLVACETEAERTSWLLRLEADQGSGALSGMAVSEGEDRSELAYSWLLKLGKAHTMAEWDDLEADGVLCLGFAHGRGGDHAHWPERLA